jgi:hypothetical protein
MTQEKEFTVNVCRASYAFKSIKVTAKTLEEANAKALTEAADQEFSETSADYSIE